MRPALILVLLVLLGASLSTADPAETQAANKVEDLLNVAHSAAEKAADAAKKEVTSVNNRAATIAKQAWSSMRMNLGMSTPEPYPMFERELKKMAEDNKAFKNAESAKDTLHALESAGHHFFEGITSPQLTDELDKMLDDADISSYFLKKEQEFPTIAPVLEDMRLGRRQLK